MPSPGCQVVLAAESDASHGLELAADAANWVIWVGFLVAVVFVLWVAPRKLAALRAHWLEAVTVVVTPPFFPRVCWRRFGWRGSCVSCALEYSEALHHENPANAILPGMGRHGLLAASEMRYISRA